MKIRNLLLVSILGVIVGLYIRDDRNIKDTFQGTETTNENIYVVGGDYNPPDISRVVETNNDIYGQQKDIVYIIPSGTYNMKFLQDESVGKAGLVEIESTTKNTLTESDGTSFEIFPVRESFEFNKLNDNVSDRIITINDGEQIDINVNIVIELTKIN
ncbi:hypothetical protein GSQ51_17875 [Clostridioides difficile]|nr:hypothetical protein [Clostridioides difficile]NJK15957.1 hypothetical protein [Clostridioides difficile]